MGDGDPVVKKTAAELRAEADAAEALEQAEALRAARAAETPEQKAARVQEEKAAQAAKDLVEDPTEEQKVNTIGVDFSGSGSYIYVPLVDPIHEFRQAKLTFRGSNIEHVAEDQFGRWLYRRM